MANPVRVDSLHPPSLVLIEGEAQTTSSEYIAFTEFSRDHIDLLSKLTCQDKESIRPFLIDTANALIANDLDDIHDVDEAQATNAIQARKMFYEVLLGWGQKTHPRHAAYQEHLDRRNGIPTPIRTFISTAYELHKHKIDLGTTIDGFTRIFGYSGKTTKEKLDNLAEQGLNVREVIKRYPRILGTAIDRVNGHLRFLRGAAHFLRWEGDVNELFEARPSLVGDDLRKLEAYVEVAAAHGQPAWRDISKLSVSDIATATIIPIECHLMAVADDSDYTVRGAQLKQNSTKGTDRAGKVHEMLRDRRKSNKLGGAVVQAYLRYKPQPQEIAA